jgi:hypothetical protein
MSAARQRGETVAARVFGATQIARARAGAEAVGSTLDCGLVPRKFEGFFAKCTKTNVNTRISHQGSECCGASKVEQSLINPDICSSQWQLN